MTLRGITVKMGISRVYSVKNTIKRSISGILGHFVDSVTKYPNRITSSYLIFLNRIQKVRFIRLFSMFKNDNG